MTAAFRLGVSLSAATSSKKVGLEGSSAVPKETKDIEIKITAAAAAAPKLENGVGNPDWLILNPNRLMLVKLLRVTVQKMTNDF